MKVSLEKTFSQFYKKIGFIMKVSLEKTFS